MSDRVFHYFQEICSIPHPSYHEEKISNYLVDFAKSHGLECYQDELYNVIIIKEATPGFEQAEPLILQGHMDMVCEKTAESTKDMLTEGLDLVIEGDWISAKGTTLGGDDGIAVAMALAILEDDDLQHPRLEFLCTVSEEVGMEGAAGVDVAPLKGHYLINIDSEEEGCILAGCAGGSHVGVSLAVEREANFVSNLTVDSLAVLDVQISGLTGGHSGAEIHKERGNADVWAITLLRELAMGLGQCKQSEMRLISIEGGTKDNAIPRECAFSLVLDKANIDKACSLLQSAFKDLQGEFATSDPGARLLVEVEDDAVKVEKNAPLTAESTNKLSALFSALPNGVIRVSQDVDNLVETSLNLGIMSLAADAGGITAHYALRSSVDSAKIHLRNKLQFVAQSYGATVELGGDYPAWQFKKDSPLRAAAASLYKEMYGVAPRVEAIHAGLECGLLSGKIPNLDCISIGPDMHDIHTTEERLSISSTKRVYDFVVKLIAKSM